MQFARHVKRVLKVAYPIVLEVAYKTVKSSKKCIESSLFHQEKLKRG